MHDRSVWKGNTMYWHVLRMRITYGVTVVLQQPTLDLAANIGPIIGLLPNVLFWNKVCVFVPKDHRVLSRVE